MIIKLIRRQQYSSAIYYDILLINGKEYQLNQLIDDWGYIPQLLGITEEEANISYINFKRPIYTVMTYDKYHVSYTVGLNPFEIMNKLRSLIYVERN